MQYLYLLLRIAFMRVKPVRKVIRPPSAIDHDICQYLKAYMAGDAIQAECMAWVYWGDTP